MFPSSKFEPARSPDDEGGAAATVVPDTDTTDAKPAEGKSDEGFWNPGWRERMAAGDAKAVEQLKRYQSPEAIWQKARALEQRLSSGELKPTLSKNAKPEELAAFRKAHGIPENPAGYDINGIELNDADKALVAKVLDAAHATHASPDTVKAIVGVWPQLKEQAQAAQTESDKRAQEACEDALRSEWGGEFRRNMALVHQLLDATGDATTKDLVLNGRLADGTPIGSSAAALKMLLGVALQSNPTGTLVPAGNGNVEGSIKDELAKFAKMRRDNPDSWKKDNDAQKRERELIDAAIKHGLMDSQGRMKS